MDRWGHKRGVTLAALKEKSIHVHGCKRSGSNRLFSCLAPTPNDASSQPLVGEQLLDLTLGDVSFLGMSLGGVLYLCGAPGGIISAPWRHFLIPVNFLASCYGNFLPHLPAYFMKNPLYMSDENQSNIFGAYDLET